MVAPRQPLPGVQFEFGVGLSHAEHPQLRPVFPEPEPVQGFDCVADVEIDFYRRQLVQILFDLRLDACFRSWPTVGLCVQAERVEQHGLLDLLLADHVRDHVNRASVRPEILEVQVPGTVGISIFYRPPIAGEHLPAQSCQWNCDYPQQLACCDQAHRKDLRNECPHSTRAAACHDNGIPHSHPHIRVGKQCLDVTNRDVLEQSDLNVRLAGRTRD